MYESIRIEGFRALDRVQLDGLRRVNLVVGRNNVGKTTLLEAMLLLAGATNPDVLLTLGRMRGQRLEKNNPDPEPIWRTFAHGFQESRIIEVAARRAGEARERALRITRQISLATVETDENHAVARAFGVVRANGVSFEYTGEDGLAVKSSTSFDGGRIETDAQRHRTDFVRTALLSAQAQTIEEQASQYGLLVRMKRELPVLEALRLLDDRIQRIEVIHEAGAPTVYCDMGFASLVPLAVCGDGVLRLFSIMVELTRMQGGVLLVDEIDSGLHHSVMVPFWRTLRGQAEQQDVQIFATTHDDDLLRSALTAFGDDLSWLRLFRLDRRTQGIVAVGYEDDALQAVRDEGFEVRG